MLRYVFINGGIYWGRIATPEGGLSRQEQKRLKDAIGTRTLVLLKPDGKGYRDWIDRVPPADRI